MFIKLLIIRFSFVKVRFFSNLRYVKKFLEEIYQRILNLWHNLNCSKLVFICKWDSVERNRELWQSNERSWLNVLYWMTSKNKSYEKYSRRNCRYFKIIQIVVNASCVSMIFFLFHITKEFLWVNQIWFAVSCVSSYFCSIFKSYR